MTALDANRPLGPAATLDEALSALAVWCAAAALPWDPEWPAAVGRLAAALAHGAARTNLVGDARPAALCEHLAEAWSVAAAAEAALGQRPRRAVDVGAGAGLEAMALALCWPDATVVAVEPRKLRAAFIEEAAQAVGLANLTVIPRSLASSGLVADFDLATARAVWPPLEWLRRSQALLARGGVAAVHGSAPGAALGAGVADAGWAIRATQDVPGGRNHAVAVFAPRLAK